MHMYSMYVYLSDSSVYMPVLVSTLPYILTYVGIVVLYVYTKNNKAESLF